MKQSNPFDKFIGKKKNSAVKEEHRQQKKKVKKEREAFFDKLKAEKRAEIAARKAVETGSTPKERVKSEPRQKATPVKPAPKILKQDSGNEMPLNKYLAHCGVCSRRDAVALIEEGNVKVNKKVVAEPGFKVKPGDEVLLNNKKIFITKNLVYILLNKPKDYITTTDDPQGRKTVLQLIARATDERVYPIGRLDRNTSGVLLLTNDGELTQKLSHPSYEVTKVYEARLNKSLTKAHFEQILQGLKLEDGLVQVDSLAYADANDKSVIGIELHSGKNRIVRRIFEHLGYDVKMLDRVMYGTLTKKNVERGKWRYLSEKEVRLLKYLNSSKKRKKPTEDGK